MDDSMLPWSLAVLPTVRIAGRFPLDDRDFAYAYRGPTHALHVYDYDGWIRFGEQREHPLRSGDLTLSPAGGLTRYHLPRAGRHWCIHFDPVRAVGAPCAIPLHLSLGGSRARVVDAISRICGLMAASGPQSELARAAASAALQELLLTIVAHARRDQPGERTRRSDAAVEAVAALVDADIATTPAMPQLAKRVGISQNRLAVAFRRRFGTTVLRYVLARRIEHAQQLLLTTDLPVSRIGSRLGFHDPQHFDKQFRRIAGCAPGAYRCRASGS
ncbi:MAG: helix-turn-helix transcriptional regulator [Planctomycetes bacterium]|nr:helix-turn-helix transcriptional regulator [Planctomycetota bacterium]